MTDKIIKFAVANSKEFQLQIYWNFVAKILDFLLQKNKDPESGFLTTGQTKALELAGIQRPYPNQKEGKKNNPKITFDKMCREKWIFIARKHGLEIEDTPKPKDQVGLTLEEFQRREDEKRNAIYNMLAQCVEMNLGVAEKIAEWEDVVPEINNFENWVLEKCTEARMSYSKEERQKIADEIVAAFAKSTKTHKDQYSNQLDQYEKTLNGYTKVYRNGSKTHFFGANEIIGMFQQATPEQLKQISEQMKEKGCTDVVDWMQKTKWYMQFDYGRRIDKELNRDQGMEW